MIRLKLKIMKLIIIDKEFKTITKENKIKNEGLCTFLKKYNNLEINIQLQIKKILIIYLQLKNVRKNLLL